MTAIRPPIAAYSACFSESLPSVAETSVRSIVTKLIGRAPVCSTSASCCASLTFGLAPKVISAPLPVGSMPSGFWLGSITGHERSWLSSTIANAPAGPQLFAGAPEIWQRTASAFVTCVEDVVAVPRELQEHDRLPVLVEVLTDAGQLQVLARHVRVLAVGRVACRRRTSRA